MIINHEPVATRLMIDTKHHPDRVLVDIDIKHQPDTLISNINQIQFWLTFQTRAKHLILQGKSV